MSAGRERAYDAAAVAGLLAATVAAFGAILQHGFVFDDFALIATNPGIRGLDPARLRWMFSSTYLTTYMPLGWASFAAVFALRGLDPAAYHAANLLAHWLTSAALFFAGRRLLRLAGHARPGASAFAAALLFCVHPFQVNTVAWAIELPDMLSTLIFLLCVFVYLGGRSYARLAAVLGLFAVSLLFRWKSLSLPFVLLALDFWPLRRLQSRRGDLFDQKAVRVWAEKAPFVILAIVAASLTVLAKSRETYAPSFVPVASARVLWLYPWALLRPWDYLVAYGLQGPQNSLGLPGWIAVAGAAFTTGAAWFWRRERPALALAWFCYAAAVLPPALSAQGGAVFVYLAYGYLGVLGAFLLAGAALRGRALLAAYALALIFVVASRREVRHWSDPVSFWSRAVALDPGFSAARGQLGASLLAQGRYDEALLQLEARLSDAPQDEVASANLQALARLAPAHKEEAARVLRAASLKALSR